MYVNLSRRDFVRWMGLLGLAAGTGALWGCGPKGEPGSTGTTRMVGDMVIVQGLDAASLDPHLVSQTAEYSILGALYDRLVERDADMNLVPSLALSWGFADDHTWEIKLRNGLTFHNGERFDANSVKASIIRFVDPATGNPRASNLKPIEEVEIVDDYTVRLHTSSPVPDLMDLFSKYCHMIPASSYENQVDLNKSPIGTGPYRFKEWVPSERLTMTAAEPHFTGQPKMSSITWRPVPDTFTRLSELKLGRADIITPLEPLQASEVSAAGATVVAANTTHFNFIGLNFAKPPLADRRVREALNYAVDKQGIIDSLLPGAAEQCCGPFVPGSLGHDPAIKTFPYDPDKARQLLSEAGYARGFELTLASPNNVYFSDTKICEAIAGQWAQIGVNTKVEVLEWGVFIGGVSDKKYDCFYVLGPSVPESNILKVAVTPKFKGFAWQGWDNPEVDDLTDRVLVTMDVDERDRLFRQIAEIVRRDAPWIFLWNPKELYGVSSRLKGWKPRPSGDIQLGEAYLEAE